MILHKYALIKNTVSYKVQYLRFFYESRKIDESDQICMFLDFAERERKKRKPVERVECTVRTT